MAKRPGRNHSAAFKAKVAVKGPQGEQSIAEMAERFQVHPEQNTQWKKQLPERAEEVFGRTRRRTRDRSAHPGRIPGPGREVGRLHVSTS